jgi:triphosphoribosyl-dephospho-CoA synthase
VTLLEAMREAAADDSIARQYSEGFAAVFELGVPAWSRAIEVTGDECLATTFVFMQFVADLLDSHVVRRCGIAAARRVRDEALQHAGRLGGDPARIAALTPELLRWDAQLRDARCNPGTSADLVVASILAAKLAPTV